MSRFLLAIPAKFSVFLADFPLYIHVSESFHNPVSTEDRPYICLMIWTALILLYGFDKSVTVSKSDMWFLLRLSSEQTF